MAAPIAIDLRRAIPTGIGDGGPDIPQQENSPPPQQRAPEVAAPEPSPHRAAPARRGRAPRAAAPAPMMPMIPPGEIPTNILTEPTLDDIEEFSVQREALIIRVMQYQQAKGLTGRIKHPKTLDQLQKMTTSSLETLLKSYEGLTSQASFSLLSEQFLGLGTGAIELGTKWIGIDDLDGLMSVVMNSDTMKNNWELLALKYSPVTTIPIEAKFVYDLANIAWAVRTVNQAKKAGFTIVNNVPSMIPPPRPKPIPEPDEIIPTTATATIVAPSEVPGGARLPSPSQVSIPSELPSVPETVPVVPPPILSVVPPPPISLTQEVPGALALEMPLQ